MAMCSCLRLSGLSTACSLLRLKPLCPRQIGTGPGLLGLRCRSRSSRCGSRCCCSSYRLSGGSWLRRCWCSRCRGLLLLLCLLRLNLLLLLLCRRRPIRWFRCDLHRRACLTMLLRRLLLLRSLLLWGRRPSHCGPRPLPTAPACRGCCCRPCAVDAVSCRLARLAPGRWLVARLLRLLRGGRRRRVLLPHGIGGLSARRPQQLQLVRLRGRPLAGAAAVSGRHEGAGALAPAGAFTELGAAPAAPAAAVAPVTVAAAGVAAPLLSPVALLAIALQRGGNWASGRRQAPDRVPAVQCAAGGAAAACRQLQRRVGGQALGA